MHGKNTRRMRNNCMSSNHIGQSKRVTGGEFGEEADNTNRKLVRLTKNPNLNLTKRVSN